MIRLKLFLLITAFCVMSSWGQKNNEYSYQPFIMDGTCEWVMLIEEFEGIKRVISNEDTLILGSNYKKIFDTPCNQPDVKSYIGAIREKNKQIFFIDNYDAEKSEKLIYDFNLKVGDRIEYRDGYNEEYEIEVLRIDTIEIEGIIRRKFFFDLDPYGFYFTWMEGIGDERDFVRPSILSPTSSYDPSLVGVWHKNKAIYRNGDKCTCSELLTTSKRLLMLDYRILQNPIIGKCLSIELHDATFSKINIYSWDGKLLVTKEISISNGILEVPLTNLQSGNYIVILSRTDNSRESARIIIL